jgi:uncharacterized protein (DUF924 family)
MPGMQSSTDANEPAWIGDVLHFWFEEVAEADWFAKRDDLDAQIHDRFHALHERLRTRENLDGPTPRALLAMVIVLDQFSRNMFRGNARAFASDPIARRLSRSAIERGFDIRMTRQQRMFLYLPFEHSEDARDQQIAVQQIGHLGDEKWTRYALAHKRIIDRFGRFPHRNETLHRHSTAEEIQFLKESADAF